MLAPSSDPKAQQGRSFRRTGTSGISYNGERVGRERAGAVGLEQDRGHGERGPGVRPPERLRRRAAEARERQRPADPCERVHAALPRSVAMPAGGSLAAARAGAAAVASRGNSMSDQDRMATDSALFTTIFAQNWENVRGSRASASEPRRRAPHVAFQGISPLVWDGSGKCGEDGRPVGGRHLWHALAQDMLDSRSRPDSEAPRRPMSRRARSGGSTIIGG